MTPDLTDEIVLLLHACLLTCATPDKLTERIETALARVDRSDEFQRQDLTRKTTTGDVPSLLKEIA